MESNSNLRLDSLVALWPVAEALSIHLPVGDLITLSRTSANLRAGLHGFPKPQDKEATCNSNTVRTSLNIGRHNTTYWQGLKDRAPFKCSSPTHTKDIDPKPCRYCSRPICDACIVRSSLSRGRENTFQNRIRYLCKECWHGGNSSKSHQLPLTALEGTPPQTHWYDPEGNTRDYCTCTLKIDGTLCLECKDLQNWEALSSAETQCHGQSCSNVLEDQDKERQRICLWCDKSLPRQIGGTTRHHWNQKMVEARIRNAASRQADLEEYNRKRHKLMTMSRREMRGDHAVRDDPDADLPQFVRHLDTMNYRSYNSQAAPTGEEVYDSKRGYWRYNHKFIQRIGRSCRHVRLRDSDPIAACLKDIKTLRFARTNVEKIRDEVDFVEIVPSMEAGRRTDWHNLKAVILELAIVHEAELAKIQQIMLEDYGFEATVLEFETILRLWEHQKDQRRAKRKKGSSSSGSSGFGERLKGKYENLMVDFNAEFASIDQVKRLARRVEVLPSSNSDGESDAGDGTSSDSAHEEDMWADYHRRRRKTSSEHAQKANKREIDSPPTQPAALLRLQQPSCAPTTDIPSYDYNNLPTAANRLALVTSASPAEDPTDVDETAPVSAPAHTENRPLDDDPPPYSADGWLWPPSSPET